MCPETQSDCKKWQKLSKAKRVELQRSEVLLAYPEVTIRFYLMYILIAIIAFLWDVLVQPFWPDPFSIFS